MKIMGIHGAFSSPNTLNYIREKLNRDWISINYSHRINGIGNIISDIDSSITSDVYIIGHSLGGVIGANLLKNKYVKGLITIASPLNGLKIPLFSNFFMTRKTFVDEINAASKIIRDTKLIIDTKSEKITSIITTRGHPLFFLEPNDGVLTVRNQDYGSHKKYTIAATHSEVLQMNETVEIIIDSI